MTTAKNTSDDIIMPVDGKVFATFVSRESSFDNTFYLHKPNNKMIFEALVINLGKTFPVGTFSQGDRLVFALESGDNHTYYTDSSMNPDKCDHVIKKHIYRLNWEDLYNLGDKDYDDLVVQIEIVPTGELGIDNIIMPVEGDVSVTFESREASFENELWLYEPEEKLIFKAAKENVGETYKIGHFRAGTQLVLALKTEDNHTYYTDSSKNDDNCDHVIKKTLSKYAFRYGWEDIWELGDKDFDDLIVKINITRPR
jgi:hypothetical protein